MEFQEITARTHSIRKQLVAFEQKKVGRAWISEE
jgi:hypothetical protein